MMGTDDHGGYRYDPQSLDASFTKLFTRLDSQDVILMEIKAKVDVHAGKVEALEKEKWVHRGMSFSGFLAACHHVLTRWGGG